MWQFIRAVENGLYFGVEGVGYSRVLEFCLEVGKKVSRSALFKFI